MLNLANRTHSQVVVTSLRSMSSKTHKLKKYRVGMFEILGFANAASFGLSLIMPKEKFQEIFAYTGDGGAA